jgi:hypothetical protein
MHATMVCSNTAINANPGFLIRLPFKWRWSGDIGVPALRVLDEPGPSSP